MNAYFNSNSFSQKNMYLLPFIFYNYYQNIYFQETDQQNKLLLIYLIPVETGYFINCLEPPPQKKNMNI